MSETPIYDQLGAEQHWTPDQLSEPFQLDAMISASYAQVAQRQWTRRHLRQLIRQRQRTQRSRRKRRTPLP